MSEKPLMEYWDFTEADLNANQHGQLTERQKTMLVEKLKETRGRSALFGLFLIGFFSIMIIGTLMNPLMKAVGNLRAGEPISADTVAIFAVLVVLLLIMIGIAISLVRQIRRKPDHTISRAEGAVNFVYTEHKVKSSTGSGHRTVRSLEMRVGTETRFVDMEDKLPNLINQGEEWAIYYTGYPFMFLSAEKIKKGK